MSRFPAIEKPQKPSSRAARFLFFLGALLALTACRNAPQQPLRPTFYFWKTTLKLVPSARAYLDSLGCNTLYVKFLDIGKHPDSGEIEPLAHLEIADTTGLSGFEIVPCVFLTNAVFRQISAAQIDSLAQRTARVIHQIAAALPPEKRTFREAQFDCDWTATTRAAYFSFLEKIREILPPACRISATLRLHQLKSPAETGVPPVARAALMLYNTGDIESPSTENSILALSDLRKYLLGAPPRYPLPMDVALPIFSWAIVLRDGVFWKILPNCEARFFGDSNKFKLLKTNLLEVQKDAFVEGFLLRPGDLMRLEGINEALLLEASRTASVIDWASDGRAIFFHLDSALVERFPARSLRAVCDSLR